MNKKGAEMTIGTIVMIILALVVLVVIIYGFSTGWSNLWENIIGFGGGKVNVQTVVQSCQIACTTQGTYDWCKDRKVLFSEEGDEETLSCFDIANTRPEAGLECSAITECPEGNSGDNADVAGEIG